MNLEDFKKKYGTQSAGMIIKCLLNEKHNGLAFSTAQELAKDLDSLLENPYIIDSMDFRITASGDCGYLQCTQHKDKWTMLKTWESYPEGSLLRKVSKEVFEATQPCINHCGFYYWHSSEEEMKEVLNIARKTVGR